jgi:hypothetical protein
MEPILAPTGLNGIAPSIPARRGEVQSQLLPHNRPNPLLQLAGVDALVLVPEGTVLVATKTLSGPTSLYGLSAPSAGVRVRLGQFVASVTRYRAKHAVS